ncbi:hypothetical protein HYPSUDRAFT_114460, partial [Hypholoma sublateritium FD-334 SS-4]
LDPLHEFGAIDGILSRCSCEDAFNLHNLILHWSMPHCQCLWENLPEAVEVFAEKVFSAHDLIPFDQGDLTFYALHSDRLMLYGQLVVALTQVIQGLGDFLKQNRSVSFVIDLNFHMLRLLAWHDNPTEMVLTIPILQERSLLAVKHIKSLINHVRRTLVEHGETQLVSSYNSTLPEEREAYDQCLLLSVVAQFAVRAD